MNRQPDAEGFLALWPTLFLQRLLPGHEAANRVLQGLIDSEVAMHADLTTYYRAENLLARVHPGIGCDTSGQLRLRAWPAGGAPHPLGRSTAFAARPAGGRSYASPLRAQ